MVDIAALAVKNKHLRMGSDTPFIKCLFCHAHQSDEKSANSPAKKNLQTPQCLGQPLVELFPD